MNTFFEVLGILAFAVAITGAVVGLLTLIQNTVFWMRDRKERIRRQEKAGEALKKVLDTMAATLTALAKQGEEDLQTQRAMVKAMERLDSGQELTKQRVATIRSFLMEMGEELGGYMREQQADKQDAGSGQCDGSALCGASEHVEGCFHTNPFRTKP